MAVDLDDLRREFEEHERIHSAEQARLYRQLTDAERLARYLQWAGSFLVWSRGQLDEAGRKRVRMLRDRDKDAAFERLLAALG